ncbi:type II toxin-antitoxin system VapC family toxin [Longimicrobium terrae]|uniref:Ribonuclease VapC n=1 Tax=Longimicrobium terrae TaxID=1639882 RepID=A0A841H519_9BACT|nr:type II toxin-antitoxin system VapC family toxin [Longimicrobium terrae]MBB4638835.1 ribonuclease VapC [Longimicrobium terrae]MBB6073074.1 ribonuclease VapC [Longimicrobium terrae]NNC30234.1 type II toxin-antitoxin system VapC family toxin [Longimicrobium terrae]
MILDTSAVIAIILQEPQAGFLIARMQMASEVAIGTATLAECGVVLVTRKKGQWRSLLDEFFSRHEVAEIDFASRHWPVAAAAYARYGKGSGQGARLNFGDCLSYAMSRVEDRALLYIGNDFGKTDLDVISPPAGYL